MPGTPVALALMAVILGVGLPVQAAIIPGTLQNVSGASTWVIESTIDNFAGSGPAPDTLQVGDMATKNVSATFHGYVDTTEPPLVYYDLVFSNGWGAASGGTVYFLTPCGFLFDYCAGVGEKYTVLEAEYELTSVLTALEEDPPFGNPVQWFFVERAYMQNILDPDDTLMFEASGRSVSGTGGISAIPLPAPGLLLAAAVLPLIARRSRLQVAQNRDALAG